VAEKRKIQFVRSEIFPDRVEFFNSCDLVVEHTFRILTLGQARVENTEVFGDDLPESRGQ